MPHPFAYLKRLLLTLLLLILFLPSAAADTVVLKNGMTIDSEKVWEENGEIKCYVNGLVVGFPQADVQQIAETPAKTAATAPSNNSENLEYDLITSKKHLDRKRRALELEYQALMQEVRQLENVKQQSTSGITTQELNERILRHNRKANEYQIKKKAFDLEVKAFQKEVAKESSRQLINAEEFTEILGSWVTKPVDDFISKWGYPDQIINLPNGCRRYLFGVEITPTITRQINLDTSQSGVIVKLTVNTANSNEE